METIVDSLSVTGPNGDIMVLLITDSVYRVSTTASLFVSSFVSSVDVTNFEASLTAVYSDVQDEYSVTIIAQDLYILNG